MFVIPTPIKMEKLEALLIKHEIAHQACSP